MSLGAGVLTLVEGQAIFRAEGDIHSNPESSHKQSHCHSETMREMLTNPRLTIIGKLGIERLLCPNSKFFIYSGSALSSQASSQALHFWNKRNRLRIPTGRRQTSWLYTNAAEELSHGLPGTNPASAQSGTWTPDLQISSPAPWPLSHAAYHCVLH